MKARYILPALLACLLLASCQNVQTPVESVPEPVSSEAVSSLPESSVPASSVPPPVTKQEETPQSAELAPPPAPASSEPPPTPVSSENTVPKGRRPMTEAEVDAAIEEAIAYAESKGFYGWQDKYSIETNGYYNPANSTAGKEIFMHDLIYHIDQLYQIALEDNYWEEGMDIHYKIVKGPIEDEENAWFGYVLY